MITNRGPGPVNANWGLGPGARPGPGAKQTVGGPGNTNTRFMTLSQHMTTLILFYKIRRKEKGRKEAEFHKRAKDYQGCFP